MKLFSLELLFGISILRGTRLKRKLHYPIGTIGWSLATQDRHDLG